MAFAGVPVNDFRWTKGEPGWIKTSSFGRRAFCGQCGSPLQVRVDHQPDTVDFPITSLDEPDDIEPEFHIFWGSKVAWFNPGDDLPKHDKFRPNTRGLEGTDPPDDSSLSGGGGGRGSA